jgi:hypothetical protein
MEGSDPLHWLQNTTPQGLVNTKWAKPVPLQRYMKLEKGQICPSLAKALALAMVTETIIQSHR